MLLLTRIMRFADADSAKCAEEFAKDEYGTKCMAKVTAPADTTSAKICDYANNVWACYPASCCDVPDMKEAMAVVEEAYKEHNCILKCAGCALRAGALTTFLVATLALLASQ